MLKVLSYGGYYVVSYLLGLYVLQGTVAFLTPEGLPTLDEEEEAEFRDEPIMFESDLPTTITLFSKNCVNLELEILTRVGNL